MTRESDRRLAHRRLVDVVRSVRLRWRLRLLLHGLTWVGAITGLVVLASAFGLERLRFAPEAVVWLRLLTWGTLVATTFFYLIRPLIRSVSDTQVALYLEEHEPSLEHAVVSALEAGDHSSTLVQRVVEIALQRAHDVEDGRRVEQGALYRFGGALTGVVVAMLLVAVLGPTHLRSGLSALLLPTRDAAAVSPYSIAVQPGDVTIARGSDQMVSALLNGFEAADVTIFTRSAEDQSFQRLSMLPALDGGFELMLLGVDEPLEYFVESTGVRSPTFTVDVADLPYVNRLDLTYRFPAYTGLEPRVIEDGGDVAALPGTVVELKVEPTMLTPGGRLLIDGVPAGDFEPQEDGTLIGRFTVGERGYYAVELARDNGAMVPASPEYTIDVLKDMEPSVMFSRPGRDMPASPIEEVYLEIKASDDYGVADVRFVFSVNGGEEDTISVFRGSGAPLADVSTGHTLYLEEWELEPGDLISYYALVRDNSPAARVIASDMYFLNVRPFERAYRQAEEQGGGGGGGGQQGAQTALSELQRQVIAATFNLIRQRDSYEPGEFSENVVSVGLAQGRLEDQVATLLERMQNRGVAQTDPGFRDVSTILPLAAEAMTRAQEDLGTEELREALPDEQEALRYLQQAEETYERFVTQQQGGGGGGGGQSAAAEDLADLFELELDKLKNQYETVRRGQQQEADNQVDELLEDLQELARRQEQEVERQRRRAASNQSGGGGGAGDSQRSLADAAEEAARQLQRLARERNDASMQETARQLQQAAEAMRQSASQSGSASSAQAGDALRRLEDARRQLEDTRADRAGRDAEDAIRQVDELQRQQREVQRDVRELPATGQERAEQIRALRDRKNQMTEAVTDLERELDQAASAGRADNPQAARKLQDAANQIRESKLKEKLQYSRGTIEQWDPQSAVTLELNIEADLQALRDQLEAAQGASGGREANPLEGALDETRDLVRGMEAMGRRLNDPGPQPEGTQDGQQQGQGGQQGEQGQGGQQGEQGQAGEQGQQGQAGEQGEQGQAGQQGQQGGGQAGSNQGNPGGRAGGGGADGQVGDYRGANTAGGATRGDPRPLTPEEIRQLRSEFGQRSDQVRDLRDELRATGRPAEELQAVLEAMRRLEDDGIYADPAQLADLQGEILAALKRLEFGLRREVEGEAERRGALSGSDEVPEGYRKLVEEYYRTLARGGGGR